ncbi:MAG: TFIIB-type zinc ribbon-containing protein [Rubricella sp.]
MSVTKIATCSYCGTRAALVFDRERHELTCPACGAPLHEMKRLQTGHERVEHKNRPSRPARPDWDGGERKRDERRRKKKKRKPLAWKIVEELIDIID